MCNYRYKWWDCGCDERFLTQRCGYAAYKGHTLHKDRTRKDVHERGNCPNGCRPASHRTKSRGSQSPPSVLEDDTTLRFVGKVAMGVFKEAVGTK